MRSFLAWWSSGCDAGPGSTRAAAVDPLTRPAPSPSDGAQRRAVRRRADGKLNEDALVREQLVLVENLVDDLLRLPQRCGEVATERPERIPESQASSRPVDCPHTALRGSADQVDGERRAERKQKRVREP